MTQRYDKYLYDVAKGLINGVYDNAVKGRRSGEKIPYFYTTVCDFNVAISLNYDSEIGLSHKLFVPDFMSKIDMDDDNAVNEITEFMDFVAVVNELIYFPDDLLDDDFYNSVKEHQISVEEADQKTNWLYEKKCILYK